MDFDGVNKLIPNTKSTKIRINKRSTLGQETQESPNIVDRFTLVVNIKLVTFGSFISLISITNASIAKLCTSKNCGNCQAAMLGRSSKEDRVSKMSSNENLFQNRNRMILIRDKMMMSCPQFQFLEQNPRST